MEYTSYLIVTSSQSNKLAWLLIITRKEKGIVKEKTMNHNEIQGKPLALVLVDNCPTMAPQKNTINKIVDSLGKHYEITRHNFATAEIMNHIKDNTIRLVLLFSDGVDFNWMEEEAKQFFETIASNTIHFFWFCCVPEWLSNTTILGHLVKKCNIERNETIKGFGVIYYNEIEKIRNQYIPKKYTKYYYDPIDANTKQKIMEYINESTNIITFAKKICITLSKKAMNILSIASLLCEFNADVIHQLSQRFAPKAKLYHESEFFCSGLIELAENQMFKIYHDAIQVIHNSTSFKKTMAASMIKEIEEYVLAYNKKNSN